MKKLYKLILILLIISCNSEKDFQELNHTSRKLAVSIAADRIQIDELKNANLLSREATDGLKVEGYTISLADENNDLREIFQDINISSSDSIIINDVYGDFELKVSHPTDSSELPSASYSLEGSFLGTSQDNSIEINLENNYFAYIYVYSENIEISSASLNQSDMFEDAENRFYAYVDTRFQPYSLNIKAGSKEITKALDAIEANVQYEFKVSRQANAHVLEMMIFPGFDQGTVVEDLDIDQGGTINLLANGSFEAAWNDEFSPVLWDLAEEVYKDSINVSDGVYSAKHIGGTHSLVQIIDVIPGNYYEISFDYFIESGDGTDARLWGSFTDVNGLSILDIRGDNSYLSGNINMWNTFSKIFQAPELATQMTLDLRVYSGATVYWDNIWVKQK
ncbi:MAG: hypothetical protein ACPGR7_00845 [Flavobacteriaceae bacterium]